MPVGIGKGIRPATQIPMPGREHEKPVDFPASGKSPEPLVDKLPCQQVVAYDAGDRFRIGRK